MAFLRQKTLRPGVRRITKTRLNGIEISLWAASDDGPIQVLIGGQPAVCFIERDKTLQAHSEVTRKPVALKSLAGRDVDALYFHNQRTLRQFKDLQPDGVEALLESDLKPHDRFLMERFIQTGFTLEGDYEQLDGYKRYINPKLSPVTTAPTLRVLSIDIETQANTDRLYSIGADVRDFSPKGSSRMCLWVGR